MTRQDPLFAQEIPRLVIPVAIRYSQSLGNCKIHQTFFEGYEGPATERNVSDGGHAWREATLPDGRVIRIVAKGAPALNEIPFLRETPKGLTWENVRLHTVSSTERDSAIKSWTSAFRFTEESGDRPGLRTPQIGALHAIHAHWTVSDEPAMLVMPTGTGKTETMLSTLVSQQCQRVLVIVPSQILRDQIFGKFVGLGLLKKLGVLDVTSDLPVVGMMRGTLKSVAEVDQLFGPCNVVVAVINSLAQSTDEAIDRITELCTHLFIDEAHHVPAATWSRVKTKFQHRRVLQFTATPYRNDGKRVEGKMIYAFPLKRAQAQGYFKPIRYRPVVEFLPELSDRAIASASIQQLRDDLKDDQYDHILMARAHPIQRLERTLKPLYDELALDLNPVVIHSQMGKGQRDAALQQLRNRSSRIVLCDNMLGEGFDFPQLKIAALHDLHKSLAITLQFTGRFTRTNDDRLGEATMIANAALSDVSTALRDLYAQDADWNRLVQELADQAIGSKVMKTDFSASFQAFGVDFPAENIQPKMSTVVYRTLCDEWSPEMLDEWLADQQVFAGPSISQEHNTAFFVVVSTFPVSWGLANDAMDVHYGLYLLHWDRDQKLLFINSTDNDGTQPDLAKLVCGEDVELVDGECVYRALQGINRLVLMNLGLKSVIGRNVKFTMLAGSDVLEGITPAQVGSKTKTNLFALGYAGGERATLGCSVRGRLWSYQQADAISDWVNWCHEVGRKLLDEKITIEEINKWFIIPEELKNRPELVALDIDWSDELYVNRWGKADVLCGGISVHFFDAPIELLDHSPTSPIQFKVSVEDKFGTFQIDFGADGPLFSHVGGDPCSLILGSRSVPVAQFCQQYPPTIYFENEAVMERGLLFTPHKESRSPFDLNRLVSRDWSGVNIRKESQGISQEVDSIQYSYIQELLATREFDVVFDDDDANEIADIVCLKREGSELHIELYHCKYSSADTPGARIDDLYEVCGQAQKSIRWRDRVPKMIRQMGQREHRRRAGGQTTRFQLGDATKLLELQNAAHLLRPKVTIGIVQPGLSKAAISQAQKELLGATQNYLMETYQIPLTVVCSC